MGLHPVLPQRPAVLKAHSAAPLALPAALSTLDGSDLDILHSRAFFHALAAISVLCQYPPQ